MSDGSDKRIHPRLPFVLRVDYADRQSCADATENLSRGGVFIQTERELSPGDQVPLALSFPGLMDPVEITGTVSWIRAASATERRGVGLRVESPADRKRLEEILDSARAPKAAANGFRVLIVEDNPHIIEMYSYVLKKLASGELAGKVPLEVHFAADGHGALKLLHEGLFHLVMTDLYMPVMDGFALVEKIRGEDALKNIPVVVISAGGKEAQDRALELGVDIYLRKPVRFVEVLETVKQLLRIG